LPCGKKSGRATSAGTRDCTDDGPWAHASERLDAYVKIWVGEFDLDFLVVSSILIMLQYIVFLTHLLTNLLLITVTLNPTPSQQSAHSSPSHKPAMA
jgi:hypothetical protein